MQVKHVHLSKIYVLFGVLLIVLADQLTKWYTVNHFYHHQVKHINDLFNWVYVTNVGSLFGLFNNQTGINLILMLVGLAVVIGALIYGFKNTPNRLMQWFLVFLVGGALGNTIDRIIHGHVIDWVDIHMGVYHWPAFNIADVSLNIGVIILLFNSLRKS